ncbi:MAG: ATP-binding cassette domain-containing protein, partial [Curvibacter sp.]
VKQAVGSMSGGEKARLVLCMLVWQRPNLLLLDEPTNHLDLATREALSVALNEFEGTVMLVSHDRALLRAVCDEFWLVSRGGISPFDGDLDDYQRYLLDVAKRQREALKESVQAAAAASAAPPASPAPSTSPGRAPRENNRTRQMRKELEQCEARMSELAREKQDLEERLGREPTLEEIQTLSARMAALQTELERTEERWLELGDALQAAG